jgi:putative pyruvate formate lyase activating enzyme
MAENRSLQENRCRLCPRDCGADRAAGKTGFCGVPDLIYVARAALHFWEEPCISGTRGSGAVFFSGCPLRCVYCQNYELAHARAGIPVTIQRLAEIFLELQEQGANNINLVTPTQYTPEIVEAVRAARRGGLTIPIVYNCSGYESVPTLQMLAGIVDIYLTDFKYINGDAAERYSGARDYPEAACAALEEMVRQLPSFEIGRDGLMKKGVIVRHLLLPGQVHAAKAIVKYVYERYGDRVWLSLMNQYTPFSRVKNRFPELARRVTAREYNALIDYAIGLGVENAFIQEGETAKESFIPAFDGQGVQRREGMENFSGDHGE